jgi:hypothetical protein
MKPSSSRGHDLPRRAAAREGRDRRGSDRRRPWSADVHTRISGVADYFAEDDDHALQICRTIVSTLNAVKRLPADMAAPEDPRRR